MIYFEALDGPFFTRYDPFAMEHPVPQNVTSFQFHLVGDMTLKQFGYLAAGLGSAYLVFVFLMGVSPILAFPTIAVCALSGVAFAFLPILDRPLDHWVKSYFKAIYSPTIGTWGSQANPKAKIAANDPTFKNRFQLYMTAHNLTSSSFYAPPITSPQTLQPVALPPIQAPIQRPVNPLLPQEEKKPEIVTQPQPQPKLPSSDELNKLIDMAKQSQMLQVRLTEAEKQIEQLKAATANPQASPAPLAKEQFQKVSENIQGLVKQAQQVYQQAAPIQKVAAAPVKVVVIAPEKPQKTQLLLTSTPNVINGILFDAEGNYLEGVIVIIHNKEGLPVRALKTNKLGQFTGSTPLPPGVYTIVLEKDNLEFETLQITLNNEVMAPLNIRAKKKGT